MGDQARVSDQNGISRLYIIVKIYHSGRKPSSVRWHQPVWNRVMRMKRAVFPSAEESEANDAILPSVGDSEASNAVRKGAM